MYQPGSYFSWYHRAVYAEEPSIAIVSPAQQYAAFVLLQDHFNKLQAVYQ